MLTLLALALAACAPLATDDVADVEWGLDAPLPGVEFGGCVGAFDCVQCVELRTDGPVSLVGQDQYSQLHTATYADEWTADETGAGVTVELSTGEIWHLRAAGDEVDLRIEGDGRVTLGECGVRVP